MVGQITQAGSAATVPSACTGSKARLILVPITSPAPIRKSSMKAPASRPVPARKFWVASSDMATVNMNPGNKSTTPATAEMKGGLLRQHEG
jgi:hypothetical protein